MVKFLLVIVLVVVGIAAYVLFSVQSLPDWYAEDESKEQQTISRLSNSIDRQGLANFLGDKFADVLKGEVVFNEDEFNALLLSSLRGHKDGRRLIAVSDAVHADLQIGKVEFGAVINLDKLGNVEPKAKKAFEQAMEVLPLGAGDKVYVAVIGSPAARNGNLALADDISVQIGSIPISNGVLKRLGIPVHRLNQEDLPLKLLRIKSVTVAEAEIRFGARPKF